MSMPRETPWFKQDERKMNRRIDIKELQLGQKLQGIKFCNSLLVPYHHLNLEFL